MLAALAVFHARAPDEAGPELWRLKRIVDAEMEDALWSHLVEGLLARGELLARGASLHLPTHSVELTPQEQAVAEPLLAALLQGRFEPPWTRDLARDFGLAEDETRKLLRKLAKAGQISQVVHDLFYHQAALAELAQLVRDLARRGGRGWRLAGRFAAPLGRRPSATPAAWAASGRSRSWNSLTASVILAVLAMGIYCARKRCGPIRAALPNSLAQAPRKAHSSGDVAGLQTRWRASDVLP